MVKRCKTMRSKKQPPPRPATHFPPRDCGWLLGLLPETVPSFIQHPWGQTGFRIQNLSGFRQVIRHTTYSLTPPSALHTVTHRVALSSSGPKELCSPRQTGRLAPQGPWCEVSLLIGIHKNCQRLYILSAPVFLPNKFATHQRKTLELCMRDCGPVSRYAYIFFSLAQMETVSVPCFIYLLIYLREREGGREGEKH